jgi:hypothetical protein
MHTLSPSDLPDFINHVAVRMREPLMIWGPPGCAKSECVKQVCASHNGVLVDVRLSQYDSVDLRGIPNIDNNLTVWNMPATLPFKGNPLFANVAGWIFLFLDELTSATPAVAAVSYQLVNDRGIGEHKLMDNVIVIAAGNRDGDRGVTNRMPTPLANRFTHCEVMPDVNASTAYAAQQGWPQEWIAFINFRKPLLSTFDPAKPDKAFATPRTWEKAVKYFADPQMPANIKQAAMAGAVGDGPAGEFWGFVDVWHKMIPISQILANPTTCALPDEGSMGYAVAVNISGTMDTKNVKPLHAYLSRMEPECIILAWQLATKRDEALFGTPEYLDFAKKYRAVFQ